MADRGVAASPHNTDTLVQMIELALDELIAWMDTGLSGCLDVEKRGEHARLVLLPELAARARAADQQAQLLERMADAIKAWDETLSEFCDGPERDAVRALLAEWREQQGGACDHDWKDMTNPLIESGEWCPKCGAVRAAWLTSAPRISTAPSHVKCPPGSR